jgi:hypothetical protein
MSVNTIQRAAKRGDLVLLVAEHSSTALHGPTTRSQTFELARVTAVSKDGRWKSAERPSECPLPWKFAAAAYSHQPSWIVGAETVGGDAEALLRRLGQSASFASLDEARDKIRLAAIAA